MKYIYLLFGLIIIYLLYCYYRKYGEQENFDPSLVPVSSIVTLAKVAQKLVDGGGTLTNPGNLQIGLPSAGALGNLYVTGTNTIDGVSTFNNPVTVNGTTTFTGDQTINGKSTVSDNLTANTVSSNQYNDSSNNPRIQLFTDGINYYNSGSGNLHHFRGNGGSQAGGNVLVDQDLTVSGNSTVTGTLTVNNTTTLKNHITFIPPSSSTNQSYTLYTAGDNATGGVVSNSLDMHTYQNGEWRTHALSVGNDGNVKLYNNLNVSGSLSIGGPINYAGMAQTGMPVGTYKIRAHGFRIPLYYGWNMMWYDHGWSEKMRTRVTWNGSTDERFVNYAGLDLRQYNDGDNNWLARYYSLLPGYKLQFYAPYTPVGPEYTGEQTFGDNSFEGKRVHMIAVRLVSESWALPKDINI